MLSIYFGYFQRLFPLLFVLIMSGLFLAGILALLSVLITEKLAVAVDNEGVIYHPRRFPTILWKDIVDVTLLPRVQTHDNGETHSYLREEWCPVVFTVRGFAKYTGRIPAFLRTALRSPQEDCARIEISFMGLSGDAREFYELVKNQLASRTSQAA
jgi:hypothetical protein